MVEMFLNLRTGFNLFLPAVHTSRNPLVQSVAVHLLTQG